MKQEKRKDGERTFLVFDERAAFGDTEDAIVMYAFDAKSDGAAKREAHFLYRGTPFVLYGATFKDGVAIEDEQPICRHRC